MILRTTILFLIFLVSFSFAQMQDPIGIKTDDGNTVYGFQFEFDGSLGVYTSSLPGGIPIVNFSLLPSAIAWIQGGNTFGTTGVFGTLDNFDINIITNGRTIMKILSTGINSNIHINADTSNSLANAILRLNSNFFGNSRMIFFENNIIKSQFGYDGTLNTTSIDYDTPFLYFRPLGGSPAAKLDTTGNLFLSGIGNNTITPFPFYMNTIERMRIGTDGRVTKNNHGVAEMQQYMTNTTYNITTTCPTYTRVSDVISWQTNSTLTGVFTAQVRISNNSGGTRNYDIAIQRGSLTTCTMPNIGGPSNFYRHTNLGTGQAVTLHAQAFAPGTNAIDNYLICVCSNGTGTQTVDHSLLIVWEY